MSENKEYPRLVGGKYKHKKKLGRVGLSILSRKEAKKNGKI